MLLTYRRKTETTMPWPKDRESYDTKVAQLRYYRLES